MKGDLSRDRGAEQHDDCIEDIGLRRPWLLWVVSFPVWTFIAFVMDLSMYSYNKSFSIPTTSYALGVPLYNSLAFALLAPGVILLALRYPIDRLNVTSRSFAYLFGSFAFTSLHVLIRGLLFPVRNPVTMQFAPSPAYGCLKTIFLADVAQDVFEIYLPLVVIGMSICYYRRFKNRELHASQLSAELARAQLQVLQSQLHPHFLFNTLHSISSLMFTDVRAADKMISRLSDFLRLALGKEGVQETTLSKELEFVEGYLQIEKTRFEDRLAVTIDIDPVTLDARVPHLLLLPIVENAIKYGVSNCSYGAIRITSNVDDKYLFLSVSDNGPGFGSSGSGGNENGMGLTTTRKRLQSMYGSDHRIEIHNGDRRGARVSLRIPLLTK